jgi:hypothetical protein
LTKTEKQRELWQSLLDGDLFSPLMTHSPEDVERALWAIEARVHRVFRMFKEWQGTEENVGS